MSVEEEIQNYIASQPEAKQSDIQVLHKAILKILPKGKLWFEDGKNAAGKVVSNPNIGYGSYTIKYANGTTREFFRIGLSANTAGISVYVMGLPDKSYLSKTFGEKIGKASVTGFCIKFKSLKDINRDLLIVAIEYGVNQG